MDTAAVRSPQHRPVADRAERVGDRPGQARRASPRPSRPAGVPRHLHHPRGGRRVGATGAPLQRGQGLCRPPAPRRQGLQAGADPLPRPPRRHRPQLPRGPRPTGTRQVEAEGRPTPRRQGAGLHRPGPGAPTPARWRHATACRRRRCSTRSTPTGSTPPSAGRVGTRTRPGPRSASCRSATPSGSGTPSASGPSCGSSTRAACARASTCGRSRCRTGPSSTSGSTSAGSASSSRPSTSPTSARSSSATACCSRVSEWVSPSRRRGGPRPRPCASAPSATPPAPAPCAPTRGTVEEIIGEVAASRISERGATRGRRPLLRDVDGGPQARGVLLGP